MEDKNIVVLKERLQYYNFADVQPTADIAAGFPIVGELPLSNTFPKGDKGGTLTLEQAMSRARLSQERAAKDIGPSGNEFIDNVGERRPTWTS